MQPIRGLGWPATLYRLKRSLSLVDSFHSLPSSIPPSPSHPLCPPTISSSFLSSLQGHVTPVRFLGLLCVDPCSRPLQLRTHGSRASFGPAVWVSR